MASLILGNLLWSSGKAQCPVRCWHLGLQCASAPLSAGSGGKGVLYNLQVLWEWWPGAVNLLDSWAVQEEGQVRLLSCGCPVGADCYHGLWAGPPVDEGAVAWLWPLPCTHRGSSVSDSLLWLVSMVFA